jgi:hypothetical protein
MYRDPLIEELPELPAPAVPAVAPAAPLDVAAPPAPALVLDPEPIVAFARIH